MNQVHMEIGSLIREYRTKKGLTQADLAEILGHETSQFVSFIERGISKTPLQTLGQLIVILGLPEKKILEALVTDYKSTLSKEITAGKKELKL